jgi:hypothetical protein
MMGMMGIMMGMMGMTGMIMGMMDIADTDSVDTDSAAIDSEVTTYGNRVIQGIDTSKQDRAATEVGEGVGGGDDG